MNELNNDWVLIASVASIVIAAVVMVVWTWKAFKSKDD